MSSACICGRQVIDKGFPRRQMGGMSDTRPLPFQAEMSRHLAATGLAPETVEALVALDSVFFLWLRRAVKGEAVARLLSELGLGLELPQFHALTAVARVMHGIGRAAPQPPTIGLMAEEMNIDPSRASRIAADLIRRGYLRREAAQEDGRKTILRPTPAADAALTAVRDLKWSRFPQVFEGWTEEEIRIFSALFIRYAEGMRRVYRLDPPGAG